MPEPETQLALLKTFAAAMDGDLHQDVISIVSRPLTLTRDDPRQILTVEILVPSMWYISDAE